MGTADTELFMMRQQFLPFLRTFNCDLQTPSDGAHILLSSECRTHIGGPIEPNLHHISDTFGVQHSHWTIFLAVDERMGEL
ncbi:hypothetical protein IFM47457_06551 [Aspergillus lentulus]|nr:hypothetical protein IFM47457_06551 [Aspergillus lentulus]